MRLDFYLDFIISDMIWEKLEAHLPGRQGSWRVYQNNRLFINAVFWIMRTGAPWRDAGIWERLLEILIDEPDYEWTTTKPCRSSINYLNQLIKF